jgi:hypothetical protein
MAIHAPFGWGGDLGGERALLRLDARGHGALDLVHRGAVEVEAHLVEEPQDGGVRGGLHREARGEPERIRELEHVLRLAAVAGLGMGAGKERIWTRIRHLGFARARPGGGGARRVAARCL